MLLPGEYYYVITLEMELRNSFSGPLKVTHRGTFPVLENVTRLKATNHLIEMTKIAVQAELSKKGSDVLSDQEPLIYLLSIDPN